MSGIQPRNCVVGECVSGFPYKDECGLVAQGCRARAILATLAKHPDGAHFPMDLRPDGNAFVNAMEAAGMVHVNGNITRLRAPHP